MKILIVDDDIDSINLLKKRLESQGMEVIVAHNGMTALEVLYHSDVRLVITDWVMPEMDGLELCRRIRTSDVLGYVYIVLLTGRKEKEDIVIGMEAGADDYLPKPFNSGELKVRLDAGNRILSLEQNLVIRNNTILNDLAAARDLQKSIQSDILPDISGIEYASRLIPSSYLSGDILNVFRLDEKHLGLYHIDIMGHGVRAALFSFFINQKITRSFTSTGLLKTAINEEPYYRINTPKEMATLLNERNLLEEHGSYFTMLYAVLNIKTGRMSMYRAGHNLPLIIRADGSSSYLEDGGAPIGLGIPQDGEEICDIQLSRGDSFFVFSDGLSDCPSSFRTDEIYGLGNVRKFLVNNHASSMDETFDLLVEDAKYFQGKEEFDDDVSIVGFKWNGSFG